MNLINCFPSFGHNCKLRPCTWVYHMHDLAGQAGAAQQQAVFDSLVELRNRAHLNQVSKRLHQFPRILRHDGRYK